ncbi:MAG: stage II sporulation protein D [Bacilli bacterium]|nr:stage II sporulation protein D [Bacilli bacterium]
MEIKRIIILTVLIILLPCIILSIFLKEDKEPHFKYGTNLYVRVRREAKNTLEEVPLEQYVVGVLSGEMPVSFEIEALKAQAVAARSYVLKKMEKAKDDEYDVVDTVSNQVYLNEEELKEKWQDHYEERIEKLKKAVYETEGEYLSYDDEIIEAFFFSTSTGVTENSGEVFSKDLPYLVSVESKWDEISPSYEINYNFSLSDFYKKLDLPYEEVLNVNITKTTSTGRVKELEINGNNFNASTIFSKLNLKSTFFTITQNGSIVNIITKGYGHGVGMSQYGAQGMAKEGYQYEDILKYYYQGVTIKNLKN